MLRLSFPAKQGTGSGEIRSETAQRLVRSGMPKREAHALAQIVNLDAETPDNPSSRLSSTLWFLPKKQRTGRPA